ncbi:HAD-IIB family hydrolase [Synechococcus sp. Cruz-9H2]|uniref:HAD-IIB family hydrolase n=1 Tax=unclassified Synechococcus TaxID=2626047 RepID=UPI0020CDB977|nr:MULTISPECIES: HAD-IIB family hydrolase [unclassified Synechococcus]MCP9820086.1 HAD-IIB family hydrolase [Synechococcus sp. Cruz-9H2]MCP9844392.1 HAD-IIB family hydrolase [Synechococcus sp. Edmonson 11F2]MCP9856516.1 HAD-IIB family hydrolase [Synechococcus sp. Cruz-9C9]MCP9863709.1 HAD-IIB family hydrolase [Synechococcus sp. Cruz-7E5]MCP9870996.1 HAD-IIB family hydrolase [Synechococcus sp. Cruz-7B9]
MVDAANPSRLYVLLISVHGLIRGKNLELGRDADTGGQTKYVVELAKALAIQEGVERVDLVTRLIVDDRVSPDYAVPIEKLAENLQIVRVKAGPNDYLPKEQLWPHMDSFADHLSTWLAEQPRMPDVVHTHYADAGYVGVRLSNLTGLPLIHTGHSLGRDKYRRLLAVGMGIDQIEQRYHMQARISAEEETLSCADLVITSTRNEIESQYELYDYYTPEKMAVIPPGTDLQQFHPPSQDQSSAVTSFQCILSQFLRNPNKPMILALSRPDERKNIVSLLEAYGQSRRLQELANLVIVAGNRDDIRELNDGAQLVLTELLFVIDYFELYGHVALPKHHSAEEVPEIYRLAAASRGVFVNPALTEPFGLTLLEAAASGLPLVATENGGPVDIIGNCRNGLLVDPLNREAIAEAILSILDKPRRWDEFSGNGLRNIARFYSWEAHAKAYLAMLQPVVSKPKPLAQPPATHQFSSYRNRALFTAIDNTLMGDAEALDQFAKVVRAHRRQFLFGIATGRRLDAVLTILKRNNIPAPDVLITSLGTEIYYTSELFADIAWSHHIDHSWTPQVLRRVLESLPGLSPQPKTEQSRFKVSYYYDSELAPSLDDIHALLRKQELSVNATLSFGQYLDVVPARASKGQALRYVANQYNIPLERTLVTGGSGGDADMLRGNTLGVVVANRHQEELSNLSENEQVYFANGAHAWGILEAIRHYGFF